MKKFGLSRTQWQTMLCFSILPLPCSQQALLQSMKIDRAHMTRTVDQLVKMRLIKRRQHPTDRRSVMLDLTAVGKQLLPKVNYIMCHESEIMLKGLDKAEQALLDQLLARVTDNVLAQLKN
jgi:DNA-binding MarR family transcriptional regulator